MSTPIYNGNSQSIAQVVTITVGYAVSDSYSVTINNKTVGPIAAITDSNTSASALQAALSSSTIPEFAAITWTIPTASNVITGTANTGGVPFSISTAQSGIGSISNATIAAASGPGFWSTTTNYSAGSIPANSDNAYFANSSNQIGYGTAQSGVTLASLNIAASMTGGIGLPQQSAQNFVEYHPTYLAISFGVLNVGYGPGTGPTLLRVDSGTSGGFVLVTNTGASAEANVPSFCWRGGNAANQLVLQSGSVGVGFFPGETGSLASGLTVGLPNASIPAPAISIGPGVLAIGTTTVNAGTLTVSTTGSSTLSSPLTMNSGIATYTGTAAMSTAVLNAGTLQWNSVGTLSAVTIAPQSGLQAILDLSTSTLPRAIPSISLAPGAVYNDPQYLNPTPVIHLINGATEQSVVINQGPNRSYTVS